MRPLLGSEGGAACVGDGSEEEAASAADAPPLPIPAGALELESTSVTALGDDVPVRGLEGESAYQHNQAT